MRLPIYQLDAFAGRRFAGNPAAVCPLEFWLGEDLMQAIANENNLAETAFVVREDEGYRIRWFTPTNEVELCGHATLAAGHVERELRAKVETEPLDPRQSGEPRTPRQGEPGRLHPLFFGQLVVSHPPHAREHSDEPVAGEHRLGDSV